MENKKSQEISQNLVCILLRSGIEIWVEKERAESLELMLTNKDCPQFIKYEGELINKADITGVYFAKTMDNYSKRKNGEWKCREGAWHEKGQRSCDCLQDISERRML